MSTRLRDVVSVLVLSLVVGACSAPAAVSLQSMRDRSEREIAELLKRVPVYGDRGVNEYVTGVARRVGGGGVAVTLLADPTLAAFATPGGRVFVHTGLLSALEDEAELAAILARELAHDPSTLPPRARKPPLVPRELGPTAAVLWGRDLQLAIAAAIDGYGPDAEREADAEARRRLIAAGYDPAAAPRLYACLAAGSLDRDGLAEVFVYGDTRRMAEREALTRGLTGGRATAAPASSGEFERRLHPLVRDNAALDARAGRWALGARQLERALASDPDDALAHAAYGELYRLQAQRATGPAPVEAARMAAEHLERALALEARSIEALRQLALLHYQQGNVVAARAAFERYLAVAPAAPDAARIRQYLAILGR